MMVTMDIILPKTMTMSIDDEGRGDEHDDDEYFHYD